MTTTSPATNPPPPAQPSPFAGHGGSYRFDPLTGQTTLIERAGLQPDTLPAEPGAPEPTPE